MTIRLAGIVEDSVVDGVGLRLTVFTQGCPHHCKGCQNPQTWDENGGYVENLDVIVDKMKHNTLLSGLSLSGGEPFMQAKACKELSQKAHELGLNVWIYTGYTFEELIGNENENEEFMSLLKEADVLIDGQFVIDLRTMNLPWRGSKNQRLINVKESLKRGEVIEWNA